MRSICISKHGIWYPKSPLVRVYPNTPMLACIGKEVKIMRLRDREFKLRFTKDEYLHIEKQAKKAGLKVGLFLRNLALGIELKARPPDEYYKLVKEINAIGININQIAHIANAERTISQEKINYIVDYLDEIMEKVRDLE